jgi:plasmid rolling circle replication initiator protein Rep
LAIIPHHLFCNADKYKRLLVARRRCLPIIQHYYSSEYPKYFRYAERMLNCSPELNLRIFTNITLEGIEAKVSIENAKWCHVRQCAMCQLAKASKQRAILFKAFAKLDLTQKSYAFLTLTHRNRPLNELRDSLSEMSRAWDKLSRRRTFPVTGFLRSMEVTMQKQRMPEDKKKNTGLPVRSPDGQLMAHPHFHILLEMEPGYFDNMKKTEWWVKEWQSALGCDYGPTVYIRKIRPGSDGDFNKAILETVKYTVKPDDFGNGEHSAEWLYGITEQLHGLRSLAVGGSIAKLCSQKSLDKIQDTGNDDNEEFQSGRLLKLTWDDTANIWKVTDC